MIRAKETSVRLGRIRCILIFRLLSCRLWSWCLMRGKGGTGVTMARACPLVSADSQRKKALSSVAMSDYSPPLTELVSLFLQPSACSEHWECLISCSFLYISLALPININAFLKSNSPTPACTSPLDEFIEWSWGNLKNLFFPSFIYYIPEAVSGCFNLLHLTSGGFWMRLCQKSAY